MGYCYPLAQMGLRRGQTMGSPLRMFRLLSEISDLDSFQEILSLSLRISCSAYSLSVISILGMLRASSSFCTMRTTLSEAPSCLTAYYITSWASSTAYSSQSNSQGTLQSDLSPLRRRSHFPSQKRWAHRCLPTRSQQSHYLRLIRFRFSLLRIFLFTYSTLNRLFLLRSRIQILKATSESLSSRQASSTQARLFWAGTLLWSSQASIQLMTSFSTLLIRASFLALPTGSSFFSSTRAIFWRSMSRCLIFLRRLVFLVLILFFISSMMGKESSLKDVDLFLLQSLSIQAKQFILKYQQSTPISHRGQPLNTLRIYLYQHTNSVPTPGTHVRRGKKRESLGEIEELLRLVSLPGLKFTVLAPLFVYIKHLLFVVDGMQPPILLAVPDAGLVGRYPDGLWLVVLGEMQSPLRLLLLGPLSRPFALGILENEHLGDEEFVVGGDLTIQLVLGGIDYLRFASLRYRRLPVCGSTDARPPRLPGVLVFPK